MLVAGLTGFSGAGKTTLIVGLIRHYLAAGRSVGAIKHTHHPLNDEDRGDTGRFRRAGADPVILAGSAAAVIFSSGGTSRVAYASPGELLTHFTTDIVLVEGFKDGGDWPHVLIDPDQRPAIEELASKLDRIWTP